MTGRIRFQRRTTGDHKSDRTPRSDFAEWVARKGRAEAALRRSERFPERRRPRNSHQLDLSRKIVRRGKTARVRARLPGSDGFPSATPAASARVLIKFECTMAEPGYIPF